LLSIRTRRELVSRAEVANRPKKGGQKSKIGASTESTSSIASQVVIDGLRFDQGWCRRKLISLCPRLRARVADKVVLRRGANANAEWERLGLLCRAPNSCSVLLGARLKLSDVEVGLTDCRTRSCEREFWQSDCGAVKVMRRAQTQFLLRESGGDGVFGVTCLCVP
jgi:hypothetical protein